MPITSYTGLPGHGKTSLMVERLIVEAKAATRPLFAAGIDGLEPGLATVLKDPRQWNAVLPGETCTCHDTESSEACNAHVVPNGALIFVDEAWKWFGHLQDATRQANPPHVMQLAEHRHRGIDFVWTFQMPAQIFPFARSLMADHYHVVRRFGTRMIDVFKWSELNEDVKSPAKRENAERTTRTLPADAWAAYKSAEIHTIKSKIPFKVIMLPALLVGAIVLGYFAYYKLRPDNMTAAIAGRGQTAGVAGSGLTPTATANNPAAPKYASVGEYATAHLPRIAVMPWTAPIFDDRPTTVDPLLLCMSSPGGEDGNGDYKGPSCTCQTEQGTAYEISEPECRGIARRGPPYNPYRQQSSSQGREGVQGHAPAAMPAPAGAPAGSVIAAEPSAIRSEGLDLTPGVAP